MSAGTSEFFCLICFLVCSCTAQEIITAERGQDVILPCKASNINNINDLTAVGWIRPGLDPEYIFLYRDGRFDPDNQHPSYQNRVDLQNKEMNDGDFSLVLKKVTMEDTGRFECRVSQKGKTEPFSIIYLEVLPPAQKKIPAERGQDVILPCKVPNINDITAAEWRRPGLDPDHVLLYRDGRFDPDNQHPSYQNRVDLQDKEMNDGDFSLILKKVKIEDTGKYECRVFEIGKNDLISIITLEVLEPDYSWIIVGVVVGVVVAVVVGVLVCLLSAAAGFLYRQIRKRKTLERTNQQLEKQKWMETVVNLKTELQNMNQELELEGPITVEDISRCGRYIRLKNLSSEEIELGGWKLKVQKDDREPDMYTFEESLKLQAGGILCLRSPNCSREQSDDVDLLWSDMKKWRAEDKLKLNLISNNGEDFRLL